MLVAERDARPNESSKAKGKHPGNSSPGQLGKKRRSGDQESEDPNAPTMPTDIEPLIAEDGEVHSEGAMSRATSPTPRGPKDMEEAEPGKDSETRKVQHPVYFISPVLRDARERYPMM